MVEKIFTNCFLVKTDNDGKIKSICLAMKKRGFGMGLWNGTGGKPKDNESIEEAMLREAKEELNVELKKYSKHGIFNFTLVKDEIEATMHAFLATEWEGEPIETEEMKPKWFLIKDIPYSEMWKSDSEFLPLILEGKKVRGNYTFEKQGGDVLNKEIKVVEEF